MEFTQLVSFSEGCGLCIRNKSSNHIPQECWEASRVRKILQFVPDSIEQDLWSCLDSWLKDISTLRWFPRSRWRGLRSLSLQHRNQTTWGWIPAFELEESLRRWHEDGSVSRQQEPKYPSWTSISLHLCRDVSVCVNMFDALALACHNKYESYRSEPKIVVATSINPTLLIASRNVFRRKNASLMFNKGNKLLLLNELLGKSLELFCNSYVLVSGRWSCFRLTRTAKHLFMSWWLRKLHLLSNVFFCVRAIN